MKVEQTILDALEGRLSASRVACLTQDLRTLSPASIFSLAQAGGLSITGDGNIVGNNNVSILVKGEGAGRLRRHARRRRRCDPASKRWSGWKPNCLTRWTTWRNSTAAS